MRGGDELHAALGDCARRASLELRADLVDDDDLGHVVLDRLDHHRVLKHGRPHLHPSGSPDAWMRDVAVTANLIGRVDDHDTFAELVREQSRTLAKHRRLADSRPAEQEDALAADDDVADDLAGAGNRAAHAHREPRDSTRTIADRGHAMQRALDAGAVVIAELA